MMVITAVLIGMTFRQKGGARLGRTDGMILLMLFTTYNTWLVAAVMSP